MLSGKFLFTLVAIVMAFFAICKYDVSGKSLVENWGSLPRQTPIVITEVTDPKTGQSTSLPGFGQLSKNALMGSGKFVSVPSYQAMLSPRFSNVQYGANIRYNMPDVKNQGSPCEPLTFGDMAKENYTVKENYGCGTGQCGSSVASCGKGGYGIGKKLDDGYELPVGFTNGNYADVYNSLPADNSFRSQACADSMSNALPVGSMTTLNADGQEQQLVAYNRVINASAKGSRLASQGDMIRGDLAITPCQTGWFSVYPRINVDLQAGALGVLAGSNAGESNSKLMDLLIQSSGGARTTFGGVDYSDAPNVNTTPAYTSVLSAAQGDVISTSFP